MSKNVKSQIINTGIILIPLFIAIFLGYSIYQQLNSTHVQNAKKQVKTQQKSPSPSNLLKPPDQNASEETKKKFFDKILANAKEAKYLDISGCKAKPEVFKTPNQATFTVKNNDDKPHLMVLNKDIKFEIKANSNQEIKADFGRGPGAYGYGCDSSTQAVGFFLLTP